MPKREKTLSNPLIIRPVIHTDSPQWQLLWEGYNRFYGRHFLAPEITQTTWERFFDATEPVHALVAEKDGGLLGLAHYLFHRSTIQIKPVCYMQDLFTQEAARGQGVGSRLIEGVYERAKLAGAARVYWQTKGDNLIARKLYDKVAEFSGFIVYSKKL